MESDEVATVEMTEADEQLSTKQTGLELWRRMRARIGPGNKHTPFAWLRALSNPTVAPKESQWQRGLEGWEGEIAKYEREHTKSECRATPHLMSCDFRLMFPCVWPFRALELSETWHDPTGSDLRLDEEGADFVCCSPSTARLVAELEAIQLEGSHGTLLG